jgi:hypothetical protein
LKFDGNEGADGLECYFIGEKGKPLKPGIISINGGDPLKTFELPATTNSEAGIAWNKTGWEWDEANECED